MRFTQNTVWLIIFTSLLSLTKVQAEDKYVPLNVRQIKVQGLIGQRIDMTINNNLLKLDTDKDFLKPFRDRSKKKGYIGLGKLIDSLVNFAAYSGDKKVLALKKQVIAEIIKTQEPDGYIGLFTPKLRIRKLWDVHEMSYLVLGLTADHKIFGEKKSLQSAQRLGDYIIKNLSGLPNRKRDNVEIVSHLAMTGIGSAMLDLYEQTGNSKYLDFCTGFLKIPQWDYPIVLGRWGQVGGHAYAYFSRALVQLRIHRIEPNKKLLVQSDKALNFLMRQDGLVISGACGDHECWHDTQSGTKNLGETCSTAYLIRWLDNLLRLRGDSKLGDLMERSIYNALFAAQSPDGRNIRYYSPFDGPRSYYKVDTYCCPGNYRRIIAELPRMIYYSIASNNKIQDKSKISKTSSTGIMINLFCTSSVQLKLSGGVICKLKQKTLYPSSGKVSIYVSPSQPTTFSLRLRIPSWCHQAKVSINGKQLGMAKPGFYEIKREWMSDDHIELNLPMKWRLVQGRKAQAGRVAIMRGPLLFCLNRSRQKGLKKSSDLRLITLDPSSLEPPIRDDSVRPGGLACKAKAWGERAWYPHGKPNLQLTLTEFSDPDGEFTYFLTPNPRLKSIRPDELILKAK